MKVNTHTNFLKRRGLIFESSQKYIIDYDKECDEGGEKSDIACKLIDLKDEYPNISQTLFDDVDTIYTKLRPQINDNRTIFRKIMYRLLESENSINSINIFAEFLKSDKPETKRVIKTLRDPNIYQTELDIEDVITSAKYSKYREYENSFVGSHFDEYRTGLQLNYEVDVDGELINTFGELVRLSHLTNKDLDWLVDNLFKSITSGYDSASFIKADLRCKSPLYDESGKVVIDSGEYVEVKYLDMYADSYLSEFFSIYKRRGHDNFIDTYNQIIDKLYLKLKTEGQYIIDSMTSNLAGIFYKSNTFIPTEYIEFYWSNVGRSKADKERRLSIRYRLKPGVKVISYVYTPGEDVMTTQEYIPTGDDRVKVTYQPQNLNESDFDWVEDHLESTPDNEKIHTLRKVISTDYTSLEELEYGHYDMSLFQVEYNDEIQEWAIGTREEINHALKEYWNDLIDDVGVVELGIDVTNYIEIDQDEMKSHCEEETGYYVEDLHEDELIEYYAEDFDMLDEFEEIDEQIQEIESQMEEIDFQIRRSTDEKENDSLEREYSDLEYDLNIIKADKRGLVSRLEGLFSNSYTEDCIECMQDPVDCLVNQKGIFTDVEEVSNNFPGVKFDKDAFIHDIVISEDYSYLSPYDGRYYVEHFFGTDYYIVRVN